MKEMKKQLFVIVVVLIMFSSSFVFILFNALGFTPQPAAKELTSFVVNGSIDPELESRYFQAGYTFLKFYSDDTDSSLLAFVESLPELTRTDSGVQLIVQEFPSNRTFARVSSYNGEKEINATRNEIFLALCALLYAPPPDCGLMNLTSA